MKRATDDDGQNGSGDKRAKRMVVAFRGCPGNFTEAAALQHFNVSFREEVDTKGYVSFEGVFDAVKTGTDFGIVPIENSVSGTLHNVYDELLNSSLYIVGECSRLEEHCLCALASTKMDSVQNIISHPAMFSQCSEFIKSLDNKLTSTSEQQIVRQSFWDTSAACRKIVDGKLINTATICPKEAALANNLEILQECIGNDKNNETRYLIIAKMPASKPDPLPYDRIRMKTSVAVALANVPNALFRTVSCFGLRSINILKMESRPAITASHTVFKKEGSANPADTTPNKKPVPIIKHWDYIFYIDFEPDMDKEVNSNLMKSLEEFTLGVRNFGTYQQNLPDVINVSSPWKGLAEISAM
jgi:arogenate/prephenate dehydratase